MLVVPSGKVLFSSQSNKIAIYTPDGAPNAAWRPVISSFPASVFAGHTYTLSGHQLNGLSQCSTYGDDATMATNYPIVRLTSNASGAVIYCRTANHSTMAVATGAATVTTSVTIPAGTPVGAYTLVVVANGIPSAGVAVSVVNIKKIEKFEKLEKIEKIEKNEKIEKVEIIEKSLIKEHKEIKEVEKPIVENKLKDAEDFEQQQQVSDPALLAALQHLSTRIDALSTQVQQQAPITPEERPEVGGKPLHSSSPLKKKE